MTTTLSVIIGIILAIWMGFTSWAWHIDSIEMGGGYTGKRIFKVLCPIYHILFIIGYYKDKE